MSLFTHSVNCPHCSKKVSIDFSGYVSELNVIDRNREMGAETEHTIWCNDFECPNCNKSFNVSGSIFEYPENSYNDDTLETSVDE